MKTMLLVREKPWHKASSHRFLFMTGQCLGAGNGGSGAVPAGAARGRGRIEFDGLAPALCAPAENAAGPSLVQRGVRAVMQSSIGTGRLLARNRCSHGPAQGRRCRRPWTGSADSTDRCAVVLAKGQAHTDQGQDYATMGAVWALSEPGAARCCEMPRDGARKAPGIPGSHLLRCASTAMARACPPVPVLLGAVSNPKPEPDGLVIRRLDGPQRGVQFVRVLGLQRAAGQIGLLAGVGVEVPQVVAAEPQVPRP